MGHHKLSIIYRTTNGNDSIGKACHICEQVFEYFGKLHYVLEMPKGERETSCKSQHSKEIFNLYVQIIHTVD